MRSVQKKQPKAVELTIKYTPLNLIFKPYYQAW